MGIVDKFRFCIQGSWSLRRLVYGSHSGISSVPGTRSFCEVDPCLADLRRKFLLLIVLISMVKHVRDLRAVVRISIREYVSIDRGRSGRLCAP